MCLSSCFFLFCFFTKDLKLFAISLNKNFNDLLKSKPPKHIFHFNLITMKAPEARATFKIEWIDKSLSLIFSA